MPSFEKRRHIEKRQLHLDRSSTPTRVHTALWGLMAVAFLFLDAADTQERVISNVGTASETEPLLKVALASAVDTHPAGPIGRPAVLWAGMCIACTVVTLAATTATISATWRVALSPPPLESTSTMCAALAPCTPFRPTAVAGCWCCWGCTEKIHLLYTVSSVGIHTYLFSLVQSLPVCHQVATESFSFCKPLFIRVDPHSVW